MAATRLANPEITEIRNIPPKTREERGQSKDDFEKTRLKARTGGFQRYEDPALVLTQPPDSLAYADDADRFNRDTVGEEKMRRDSEYARKEMVYYNRRVQRVDREEARWRTAEMEHAADEGSLQQMRDEGAKWRRNKTSVPYNLLSMQYSEDTEGERLRLEDDRTRYRASLRAASLHSKDTMSGFNPITGEPAPSVETLERPRPEDYNL